jgi:glyoxylase-like metal-dependent hydrolase (beta-lactamase superfamily II)
VAEGVHRIPLPLPNDGLRSVNVYAIADGDGLTLVDSGWALAEARQRLEDALASIGHELGDVRRFLVTHVHRDHYTMAVVVRRLFGSRVLLGAGEQESLDLIMNADAQPAMGFGRLLLSCGAAPLVERMRRNWPERDTGGEWEKPDAWLDGTGEIALAGRTLRAIPTPGHTRGHLVFADLGHGLLFAGDHVLPHITPSIGFEAARPPLPLWDYLGSLRLVRSLPDLRLLPAHGGVTGSTHARIDELLAHHDQRLDASAAVIRAGASTAYEAARALRWTRRERLFDDLDPFNQMMAVMETAAHLDVLVRQGRLRSSAAAPGGEPAAGPAGISGGEPGAVSARQPAGVPGGQPAGVCAGVSAGERPGVPGGEGAGLSGGEGAGGLAGGDVVRYQA